MPRDFAKVFQRRLKETFPWLKAMEPYKGMGRLTLFICTKPWCGHEWQSRPDNLLNKTKHGCPECAKFEQQLAWREETIKWLKEERKDLILKSELVDYDTPADWQCAKPECMHEWTVNFQSIRGAGSGCPKCGIEKVRQSKIYPEEKFREWLKKERPYIELISYTDSSTNAKFHCLNPTCDTNGGKYWETQPEILRLQNRGHSGCRDCGWKANGVNQSIPEAEIREWVAENKPTLEMGDGYENTKSKVDFTCLKCGYEWRPNISSIIYRDAGCPSCAGNAVISLEVYKKRLKEVSGETIALISDLFKGSKKSRFKCLHEDCKHEWEAIASRLISSSPTGCPGCTETGFNHLLASWIYLMEKEDEMQFGITNDLPGRLAFHSRNGWSYLDSYGPCSGSIIFKKESELKIWLKESIGLEIEGKTENWLKKRLVVQSLSELFEHSSVKPLTAADKIPEGNRKPKRVLMGSDEDEYPEEWNNLPSSKLAAYEKGAKRFFNGKRCRQGHLSPRYTSGACCECVSIALKKTTQRAKDARAQAIIAANEYRRCPECGGEFLRTPAMREDKIFCSKKCAEAESKRNYVINNPERVKESKTRHYKKVKGKNK